MKTRLIKISLSLAVLLFVSCFGDKKAVDVAEMNNTSFVNKNFDGNIINYKQGVSACEGISAQVIARLYDVTSKQIHIEDPTKSDRYSKDMEPICSFFVKVGDNDFEWLRGSMALNREIGKDELMGEIAEAVGSGENWEEAWAMKKSISKSSEWVKDIGMAALWNERKKELKIKFEGYTLKVYPMKNTLNKAEVSKNRDYKAIAIAMAKAGGYIN